MLSSKVLCFSAFFHIPGDEIVSRPHHEKGISRTTTNICMRNEMWVQIKRETETYIHGT